VWWTKTTFTAVPYSGYPDSRAHSSAPQPARVTTLGGAIGELVCAGIGEGGTCSEGGVLLPEQVGYACARVGSWAGQAAVGEADAVAVVVGEAVAVVVGGVVGGCVVGAAVSLGVVVGLAVAVGVCVAVGAPLSLGEAVAVAVSVGSPVAVGSAVASVA